MVAKSSPDWLPAGWAVQFRVQKTGRKIMFYTNLETGKKFFSKDDVMRHIKMTTTHGEKPQPTTMHTKNHSEKIPSQLVANTNEYPDWLPNGWKVEVRTRKTGVQVGREYKCYIDPLTECTFYSKPEVFRYLKTIKRKNFKSRNLKIVSHKRCIIKRKTVSTAKSTSKVSVEKHNVEDLPPGWIKEIKVKKVANRLRRDPYYTDPVTGYVFRSKKDVIHYLETGEISKHAFKRKNMCTNDLEVINDEIALSSATKRQKLKHPVPWKQLSGGERSIDDITVGTKEECANTKEDCSPNRSSQPKAELSDKCEGKRPFLEVETSIKGPGKMIFSDEPALSPADNTQNEKNALETLMEKSNVRRAQRDSSKSKNKDKFNLPRRSSKRLAGIEPEQVANLVSSKRALQVATRKSSKSDASQNAGLASAPPVRTRKSSKSYSSQDAGLASALQVATRKSSKSDASQDAGLASALQVATRKSSKSDANQDAGLASALQVTTRQSNLSDASQDAGVALDHFVNSASQQLGVASETEVAHHSLTDINSTLHGEPWNKGKMPLEDQVSREQALQVAARTFSKSDATQDAGSASDHSVNRASQQLGVASETEVAHKTLTDLNPTLHGEPLNKGKRPLDEQVVPKEQHQMLETEKPEPQLSFLFGSDPCLEFAFKTLTGEFPLADTVENRPILKPAANILQKENSLESGMEKSCDRKRRAISNKSKKNKELKLPQRSSKRLAGVEPELLANTMSSERALRKATEKSPRSKAIPAVDLADETSQQLDAGPEAPCTTRSAAMHEEPSNKSEKSLEDQAVPEEKQQKFETDKADVGNPEPQFSFPFADSWSDPCLDFAYKTLTGAIPIEDDLFQGYFQDKLDTSHNHRDSLALPDFGSPSFFQNDISPQFDAPEQSVSGQQLSMNPSFPPAGNVSLSNCSGVGSQKPCLGGNKDYHGKVKS